MIRLPHYYTGFVFLLFGTWHMITIPLLYLRSKKKYAKPFMSNTYFTQTCCGRKFPVESVIKAALPFWGAIWEFLTRDAHVYNDYRIAAGGEMYLKMIYYMQWQHVVMFAVFSLIGFIEIMDHYRVHLPPKFSYVMYSIALGCEGILFYWHYPAEKKPLITELHLMQVYIIVLTFFVGLVEMMYRESVLPALCVRYLLCLQGIWFFVVDTITDPQPWTWTWDANDHFQMMTLANVFSATIVFTLFYCLLFWFFCCWKVNRSMRLNSEEEQRPKQSNGLDSLESADTERLLQPGDEYHD